MRLPCPGGCSAALLTGHDELVGDERAAADAVLVPAAVQGGVPGDVLGGRHCLRSPHQRDALARGVAAHCKSHCESNSLFCWPQVQAGLGWAGLSWAGLCSSHRNHEVHPAPFNTASEKPDIDPAMSISLQYCLNVETNLKVKDPNSGQIRTLIADHMILFADSLILKLAQIRKMHMMG